MLCKLPWSVVSVLVAGSIVSLQCKAVVGIPATSLAGLTASAEDTQPPSPSSVSTVTGADSCAQSPAQLHLALAQSDALGLLEAALARWETVPSYRVTLRSQERVRGSLTRVSVIQAQVLREPASVSFQWIENAGRVDRLLWQPASHEGKLVVHPTGLAGRLLTAVRLDPDSDMVRNSTRRSVTRFGLANVLREVVDDYRENAAAGNLTVEAAGPIDWEPEGVQAILLKRTTQDAASESRTMMLWLEASTLRPLRVEQFGREDELLGSYSFENYQSAKLTAEDFALVTLGLE